MLVAVLSLAAEATAAVAVYWRHPR